MRDNKRLLAYANAAIALIVGVGAIYYSDKDVPLRGHLLFGILCIVAAICNVVIAEFRRRRGLQKCKKGKVS
jgi:hypothetical protein